MKLLIPATLRVDSSWPPDLDVCRYDIHAPLPPEFLDADFLVIWGNPRSQVRDCAKKLGQLKWVQDIASGTELLHAAGFAECVVMTNGRSLHDLPVAEHALALALCAARRIDLCFAAQAERRWAPELGGIQSSGSAVRELSTLRGAYVLIWGFGSIGMTLARYLSALGARVIGVARSRGVREGYPVVDERGVDEHLPKADIVVMVLPREPSTVRALDARRIDLLPRHAWVINVGRGSTVDEETLVDRVSMGHLGGAALDVFEQEPLPPSSRLWATPNVIVSPHAAGGRPVGAGLLIRENLDAMLAGRPMRNTVSARGLDTWKD